MALTLHSPIEDLPHATATHVRALHRCGIATVDDLLTYAPRDYDDVSTILPIRALERDVRCTVSGTLYDITTTRSYRKRMRITSATLQDAAGDTIRVVWFNDRYIGSTLRAPCAVRISGTVGADLSGLILTNPEVERAARPPIHTARLVPIYSETRGLTSRWLRWRIYETLTALREHITDIVPEDIRKSLHLPDRFTALRHLHFPRSHKHAELARKCRAFEEMLVVQLHAQRTRQTISDSHAHAMPDSIAAAKRFTDTLPFSLTTAQRRAVRAICTDMTKTTAMNRLLNGDVGSGKTVVAATAISVAREHGHQSALMAPTEVLAKQHFSTLRTLLPDATIALLCGAQKQRNDTRTTRPTLLRAIAAGEVDIIVGTHALISDDIHFHDLALAVIDEQHRFGVAQRSALQHYVSTAHDGNTHRIPHTLSMTATPIPRSLALALFGDMDVSVIDELPSGRQPVTTRVVGALERDQVYAAVREQLRKGRQAYIILPLVEQSGTESLAHVKAATQEAKTLQHTVFPDATVDVVHGRLSARDKDAVMQRFREGAIDVLVATAVVEVGVDVPNATVMIIEGAERFGLSQLHQFRGRIGRGTHPSYCYLFTSKHCDPPPERLQILARSTDGFTIAEEDLALRGAGQFFGTRQSGVPDIAMAHITNVRLIEHARNSAAEILHRDPSLRKHRALRYALSHFAKTITLS